MIWDSEMLSHSLLLADRGYFEVAYLRALDEQGASYVVRGYCSINPTVLDAFTVDGERLGRMGGKRLQDIRFPKRAMVDLDVRWGQPIRRAWW